MAWTAPSGHVWVTGEIVTAASLNTYVRLNLEDLDRRTAPTQATVLTEESTSTTTFGDLATPGPAVTVTIGSTGKGILSMYCSQHSASAGGIGLMGWAVSGAFVQAASDLAALAFASPSGFQGIRHGLSVVLIGMSAGSCTFTAKYRSASGTTDWFRDRILGVSPLGS